MATVSLLTQYVINELKKLAENPSTPAKVKLESLQQILELRPKYRQGRQSVKRGQERSLLGRFELKHRSENVQNPPNGVDKSLLGITE